jgi:FKBP-type peptidyl-prolyl cis-trans isomerase
VFDSTARRGPFTFTLGAGNVIQAWDRGIVGMRVGGRRRLTVPPELAYGNHGLGTSIPPNAVVVFEVELVAVK